MAEPATPILTEDELRLIASAARDYIRAIGDPEPQAAVDALLSGSLGAYAAVKTFVPASKTVKKKYWNYSQTKGPDGRKYMSSDARDMLLSMFGISHANGTKEKFRYATRWLQALQFFGFGEGKNFTKELAAVKAEFGVLIDKYGEKDLRGTTMFSPPVDEPPDVDTLAGVPARDVTAADILLPPEDADSEPEPTLRLDAVPPTDPEEHTDDDPPPSDDEEEEPVRPVPPIPVPEPAAPPRRKRRLRLSRVFFALLVLVGIPVATFVVFEIPAISELQGNLGVKPLVPASAWAKLNAGKLVERVAGDPESTEDVDWAKAEALGKRVEARVTRLAQVRKDLLAAKEEFKVEAYRKRLGQLYDGAYKGDVESWVEFERKGVDEFYSLDGRSTEIAELRNKIESKSARRSEIQRLIDIEKEYCNLLGFEWRANATPLPTEGEHATKGAIGHLNRANRLRGLISVSPPRESDRTIEVILSEKK